MRPWSLFQVSTGGGKVLGLEGANVDFQRGLSALSDEQIICVFSLHQRGCEFRLGVHRIGGGECAVEVKGFAEQDPG